ncbi:MAG: glycerate kinase [Candidatus Acetothermia bacterium]|nr:glycerate kinase [Candidatus Acetothermia bacterium]
MGKGDGLRADAWRIVQAALAAVDPTACVHRALRREDDRLRVGESIYDLRRTRRVVVVGMGKAAARMAVAVEEAIGDRISAGLVVTADGCGVATRRVEVVEAGHPVPDARGLAAARRIVALVDGAGEDDLVIVLISGGGSALLTLPAEGLSLDDLAQVNALLLRSGAPIHEMNTVRKHLSQVKGGQLARRAAPAQVLALILSDVPGDPLDVIASGPTVPDPTTYADAERVLRGYGLWDEVPLSVRGHIAAGATGGLPETPKPGDPLFTRVVNVLVGTGRVAAEAARAEGEALGYQGLILTTTLAGEAREVGKVVAAVAREAVRFGRPVGRPGLLVAAGETTVTVRGPGKGGRNQELALSAARGIAGIPGVVICALGTDGRDGPTDAAGAIVDGGTVARMREAGVDPAEALTRNDAGGALRASGDLLVTGPTGTNVADLCLVLVGRDDDDQG